MTLLSRIHASMNWRPLQWLIDMRKCCTSFPDVPLASCFGILSCMLWLNDGNRINWSPYQTAGNSEELYIE